MRVFLDTANIDEIREATRLGVIRGVTTNPSLLAKERTADMKAVIQEIASIVDRPISAKVPGRETRCDDPGGNAGLLVGSQLRFRCPKPGRRLSLSSPERA